MRLLVAHQLFGRAAGDDLAAGFAAFGPEIDEPIRGADHVQVVLDDEHGVTRIDQAAERAQQLRDVIEVQAGRRFVEEEE